MLSSRFLSPNTSLLYESTFSPTIISKNTRRERHYYPSYGLDHQIDIVLAIIKHFD